MRVSELSHETNVSVASIKYYLREGLLPAGETLGARQADYGNAHITRLRLIRALVDVVGLPIAKVKSIFELIENPGDDMFSTLGKAVDSLPPYAAEGETDAVDYPKAREIIESLDWTYDARYAATGQLERSLGAIEGTGVPMSRERLEVYSRAARMVAEFDIAHLPQADADPSATIEYSVLGTALYEPILVALRRLAHQDIAARALARER